MGHNITDLMINSQSDLADHAAVLRAWVATRGLVVFDQSVKDQFVPALLKDIQCPRVNTALEETPLLPTALGKLGLFLGDNNVRKG